MTRTEASDFGPAVGTTGFVQFSGGAFHNACLQANSKVDDSTGLRIHSGARVAIRFLLKNPQLVSNHDRDFSFQFGASTLSAT